MTGSVSRTGIVGREHELAGLERALTSALGGCPSLVVVWGPAGIGKTATVEHFLSLRENIGVVRSNAMAWEQDAPLSVVDQLLRGSGDAARPTSAADPLTVAAQLLELWARPQPLVVVVDDAHWADADSLRAVLSAYRRMTAERVLILLISRDDEELAEDVDECLSHAGPALRVGPLHPAEVQALALQEAGVNLPAPQARRLTDHTGGNPLHIIRLLHEVPPSRWAEYQSALPAPRALSDSVARTLRSASSSARALVESAAVLGETASFAEAACLAGIDEPLTALDEASHAGLLSTGGGPGVTTVRFPSRLVRAAVYTGLRPMRRQELHRRAAESAGDEGNRLLHRAAVTPFASAETADELDAFAVRQAKLGAWSEVADALVHASRLSPDESDRQRRLVRAVDALVGAGDLPQAIALSPAIESFPASGLRDAVLGYLAIQLGRPAEAEQFLSHAWQQCDRERDPGTAALICQRRVLHSLGRWRGGELVAWARQAVELTSPDDPAAVESTAIIGLGLAGTGQLDEAKAAYDEVVARVSSGAQSQRVRMGKGWLDLALDEPLTARWELESAVPTEYRRGSVRISLWAQAWLARTEFALGAWDDAIHTVHRAAAVVDESGLELLRPLVHWTGAQIHALRGFWETAHDHLRQASASSHSYEVMLIPACLARAQFAEAQADYGTVVRCLEPLVRLQPSEGLDEPGFWPWQDVYANALVMTNRVEEADTFLTPCESLAAQRGHRSTMARLGYVRGRIHGASGDIDTAKDSFESALDHLQGLPLPYERARVNFAYGQTLRRAGKRREADVALQNARDAYAALDAQVYVERCDRELKAGGLHAKRTHPGLTELTPQEQAVAKLVAAGLTNKQVATELYVSVKTVQFHLTRIYGKLGMHSRSELAAGFRDES